MPAMKEEVNEELSGHGTHLKEWRLVERILHTEAFQRSKRHQTLLRYLVDRGLAGKVEELSERQIGHVVFSKGDDYTTLEDSTVRVQVRQLRFKLQEYFNGEGRQETLVVEIPKGSYLPQFRSAVPSPFDDPAPAALPAQTEPIELFAVAPPPPAPRPFPWVATLASLCAVLLACLIGVLWKNHGTPVEREQEIPWPLAAVLDKQKGARIVVADASYGIYRVATGKKYSLGQYLQNADGFNIPFAEGAIHGNDLNQYFKTASLTPLCDVMVAANIARVAAQHHVDIVIRSQRDLQPRDLDEGNYVLLGSPAGNLWSALFQDHLNFRLVDDLNTHSSEAFLNQNPKAGEQTEYKASDGGESGDYEYADIALIPASHDRGSVLILQGLHQPGTEAAGKLLTDPAGAQMLKKALGVSGSTQSSMGFEALIRARVIHGNPDSITIVATRVLR